MKRLGVWILVALAAAFVWTLPAYAGKQVLSEAALDLVTAAGQPKIVQAIATGGTTAFATATLVSTGEIVLAMSDSSQTNLRALVLNNVSGENQLATGINIQAGTGGAATQSNSILQSWGSTKDLSATSSSPGCATAASCKGIFTGASGRKLTAHADVIVDAVATSAVSATAVAFIDEFDDILLALALNAQSSLVALVVNNVAGFNQVANGVNIHSAANVFVPSSAGGVQVDGGGFAAGAATQSNTINQYRGTPADRPSTTK